MTDWATDRSAYEAYLPAQTILGQISAAVVVTDRQGNLLYANPFAVALFGFPPTAASCSAARSCPSRSPAVTPGRRPSWPSRCSAAAAGTARSRSSAADGSRVFVRAQAMPLRHPSGSIDGIVIIAREASRRSSRRERDRIALLERIGEQLAGSLELSMTLRHVAETLVPQFADHCIIDLFQGDKLIRRVADERGRAGSRRRAAGPGSATRSGTPRAISASRP